MGHPGREMGMCKLHATLCIFFSALSIVRLEKAREKQNKTNQQNIEEFI